MKNMWEKWAEELHEGKNRQESIPTSSAEIEDYEFIEKVYSNKEKVSKVTDFTNPDIAWERLVNQIRPRLRIQNYLKYAAIVAVTILLTGSMYWYFDNIMVKGNHEFAVITAPNGQICNVTLFDSTNVWLNAGSSIKYRNSFNKKDREIYLDGEALFSVKKNKKIPFIVNAGNTKVQVFGTEFNVKAYRNDDEVEAVLLKGEIQFSSKNKKIQMKPGELLSYSKSTGGMSVLDVNTDEHTSWKGGKIYYSNETLISLTNQLERWYEIDFRYENESLKMYRFTGVVNKERSLEYTLNVISGHLKPTDY